MSLSQQKLGFHFYPYTDHYTESDLDTWLPILGSTGASWLTLQTEITQTIPESFIRPLIEAGIKPVVHIVAPIGSLRMAQVYTALKDYAEFGVKHVVFYDRPNLRSSWQPSAWTLDQLVGRFCELLIPVLEAQVEMGLHPIYPPLEPGGDYWDTAFLENSLAMIRNQASEKVVEQLTLGIYMWSYGRPLDWGQGGKTNWPKAKPYGSPDGFQDQRGFRINDWYQEVAQRALGSELPMIVVAGGAGPTELYASAEEIQVGNGEVARHLALEGLAEYIQNFNFYPLATAEGHNDFSAAWYTVPEKTQKKPDQVLENCAPCSQKDIEHYILLGLSNQIDGSALWAALAPLVLSARPTIGFSLEEAKRARRVSIIGDSKLLPETIEDDLKASGATCQRFNDWDTDAFLIQALAFATQSSTTGVEHE